MEKARKIPRFVGEGYSFDPVAPQYGSRPDYPESFYRELCGRVRHLENGWVVDLGCGDARLAEHIAARDSKVFALDQSAQMLAAATRRLESARFRVHLVRGEAENLPIPRNAADVVIIGQAFHWMRKHRVAREVTRVLKPRGLWIVFWVQPQMPLPLSAQIADDLIAQVVPNYDPTMARQLDAKSQIPAGYGFQVQTWQTEFTHTYGLDDYTAMTASKSYVAASLSDEDLIRFKARLLQRLQQSGLGPGLAERYLLTACFAGRGGGRIGKSEAS